MIASGYKNAANDAKLWATEDAAKTTSTDTQIKAYLYSTLTGTVPSGFVEADAKASANKLAYLNLSATAQLTSSSTPKATDIGKSFGRFGQGPDLGTDGTTKPFIWQVVDAAAKPTMMISLFPEMGGTDWADWDTATYQFKF